jgi:hypothetical protein
MRRAAIFFATRRKIFPFSARASVSKKNRNQIITLIAVFCLTAIEAKQRNQRKEQP